MMSVAERSRAMLDAAIGIDSKVAAAFEAASLPALRALYASLQEKAEAAETALSDGQDACGCDVALTNLLIIVGFAINKLDGAGRHQDWMLAESLELLESYREMVGDCATDAAKPSYVSRLTARHIEAI